MLTPEERRRFEQEKALREFRAFDAAGAYDRRRSATSLSRLLFGGLLLAAILWAAAQNIQPPKYDEVAIKTSIGGSYEITQLRTAGVVYGVSVGSWGIALTVGPNFAGLPFDKKTNAMQAIARAAGSPAGDHFLLYDYRDNRKLGAWRGKDGLVLF